MSNFDQAFLFMIKHEGGLVDNAIDHGGITNFGITMQSLNDFRGNLSATPDDIKNLTSDEAKTIYKALYWDPLGLDGVLSLNKAQAILDQSVNRGVRKAALDAQIVLGVAHDGVFGAKTILSLNEMSDTKFLIGFYKISLAHYVNIVKSNPSQIVFLSGWVNRINDILDLLS